MLNRALKGGTQLIRGVIRTGIWGVRLERGVKLQGKGRYDLHRGSVIRNRVRIYVADGATLTLGKGASIGSQSIINVASGLSIGRGTRISWRCQVLDTDFHAIVNMDGMARPLTKRISIGDNVLVATGSIILKGATIGHDTVIGAGAVVTGRNPIPPRSLVAGNPAEIVSEIGGWIP